MIAITWSDSEQRIPCSLQQFWPSLFKGSLSCDLKLNNAALSSSWQQVMIENWRGKAVQETSIINLMVSYFYIFTGVRMFVSRVELAKRVAGSVFVASNLGQPKYDPFNNHIKIF